VHENPENLPGQDPKKRAEERPEKGQGEKQSGRKA
jgi:hypothetical protein